MIFAALGLGMAGGAVAMPLSTVLLGILVSPLVVLGLLMGRAAVQEARRKANIVAPSTAEPSPIDLMKDQSWERAA